MMSFVSWRASTELHRFTPPRGPHHENHLSLRPMRLLLLDLLLWKEVPLLLPLLFSVRPAVAEQGFDPKYERDYNIFNPANEYAPDNHLNPAQTYAPDNSFNAANRYDPSNPVNPTNRYSPNNPFNPANQYNPDNPLKK
jgi:hypothetical protein